MISVRVCLRRLLITSNTQPPLALSRPAFSHRKPESRKTFFDRLLDNIDKEKEKKKEISDSVERLHQDAEDAVKSQTVQKVIATYRNLGSEVGKSVGSLKQGVQDWYSSAQKSDTVKQLEEISKDVSGKAKSAAEAVSKGGEKLGQSTAYKTMSKSVATILEELDQKKPRGYAPPQVLRMRKTGEKLEGEYIQPNTQAQDMVLHKDSIWAQSWQKIKENNAMFNKVFDLKTKYDESDHLAIRASRAVTDRITSMFGGVFSQNEISEVMTEIVKMDPTFTKEKFIQDCQVDIIPTILEAVTRGELDVLKDWCSEAPYNVFAHSIQQWRTLGYSHICKILDLANVDVLLGKLMEQGPVLIISFQTQQIEAVVDASGKVIEGDVDKVMRVSYVWALCRDQQELDPRAAWKLMEASVHDVNEQWV